MAARQSSARAARRARRAEQRARPRPVPAARTSTRAWLVPLSRGSCAVLVAAFLVVTAVGIGRRITWYLAVDQFGYLTFATDLLHGRVFHEWPPMRALAAHLPPRVDVLVQTYVWDAGRMYCRYAPGFPIMLASWMAAFGRDGAHYLNPTVFMGLLVLVTALGVNLFRSWWRAAAAMALAVLCPTFVHLWALTLTRDLAGHLVGILGVFLLLPWRGRPLRGRQAAAAALAFGFAASIRPDAIFYAAFPGVAIASLRWWRERAPVAVIARTIGMATLGLVLGLAPLLAFNWMATGNPFLPTQGMELKQFLQPAVGPRVGYPPGAWRGGILEKVQGGGLSLRNLPTTLPGNLQLLHDGYGEALLALAGLGAVLAAIRRRLLFAAVVPYVVIAFLFFSCWTRPDGRYLAGIHMLLPLLIVEGLLGPLDLTRRLALAGQTTGARSVALGTATFMMVAAAATNGSALPGALPTLVWLLPLLAGLSAIAAAVWPARRVAAITAPALGLLLVLYGAWRGYTGIPVRASFQKLEKEVARATFAQAVKPPAVVITSEDVGRPMENIEWYSGVAHAVYLTDLKRWRLPVPRAAKLFAEGGFTPYLLIAAGDAGRLALLEEVGKTMSLDLVADIPARHAIDYFVAAPFHRGIHMELYRLTPVRS